MSIGNQSTKEFGFMRSSRHPYRRGSATKME